MKEESNSILPVQIKFKYESLTFEQIQGNVPDSCYNENLLLQGDKFNDVYKIMTRLLESKQMK